MLECVLSALSYSCVVGMIPPIKLSINSSSDTLKQQDGDVIRILVKEGGATSITCTFSPYAIPFPVFAVYMCIYAGLGKLLKSSSLSIFGFFLVGYNIKL